MTDGYVLFDLEWNSPFRYVQPKCPCEIMEIGAVKVDSKMNVVDTFRAYVQPGIYKQINPWVKKLTGICELDLNFGLPFPRAMKEFRKWMDRHQGTLVSWGTADIVVLKQNCRYYHPEYNFRWLSRYIDLQTYCGTQLKNTQPGLKLMATILKIDFDESTLHSALNDSILMTDIFKKCHDRTLIKAHIIDGDQFEEIPKDCAKITGGLPKFDPAKLRFNCPSCGRFVNNLYGWTEQVGKLWALCFCGNCNTKLSCHLEVRPVYRVDLEYLPRKKIINSVTFAEYEQKIKAKTEGPLSQGDQVADTAAF